MATTNAFSTVLDFVRFLGALRTVPDKDSDDAGQKEKLGTGDNAKTVFWLNKLGVLESTYSLFRGGTSATTTALTEGSGNDYIIDLDTSKVTLTSTGVTAVDDTNVYATYSYNHLELLNSNMLDLLNAAENRVLRDTEVVFADSNVSDPGYRKVLDEPIKGHRNPYQKVFDLKHPPLLKFSTTVNGAYTTSGTTLTLVSGSLLPNAATIYIGGNKVAYTARSSNDLTVPSTTPSIADGAVVRGEVIELSIEPEGSTPSYAVQVPDTEYEIDYDQGRIKLLNNAYFGEIAAEDRIYPSNYLIRVSYMHAWHELGENPTIPDEIEWVVNALAARKLMGSVVAAAHAGGLNKFNPSLVRVDEAEIKRTLDEYSVLNVGTSPYNRQSLS